MQRAKIYAVKAEAKRLLEKIDQLERCAGWTRYECGTSGWSDFATTTPHPNENFNYGQYTAAVRRASLDLTRALSEMRK